MKAIEVLFMFFTAVLAGDFTKAHSFTSKTWGEKNSPDKLKEVFKNTPKDASFEIDRVITDLSTDALYSVLFSSGGKTSEARVPLVRETWPGKKNQAGDWGVDPDYISFSDQKPVKEKQEKEPETKSAEVPSPDTGEYARVLAKAEDLGIEVPEGSTTEQIQKLIDNELTAEVPGPTPKPAAKKAPAKKPAAKKPAAKKGGAK